MILSLFNDDIAYITYRDESGKVVTEFYTTVLGWVPSCIQNSSFAQERKSLEQNKNFTILHDDGED